MRPRPLARSSAAVCVFAVVFAAPALANTPASKPTLEQVSNQVYCLCGCVTLLNRCPHLPSECQSRAELQAVILKDIQQGKTDKAILDDLVSRYGVRVLASPPAAGFDLAAWILPGVALLIGLAAVLVIVRRWRARVAAASGEEEPVPADPTIAAAVEEEMRRIESLRD